MENIIQALWARYYVVGITSEYHGDMAHAFRAMLADPQCNEAAERKMRAAIRLHREIESSPEYKGRKWFCEYFPINRPQTPLK
jgi:hypothetical protein